MRIESTTYYRYAQDVIDGKIVACRHIIQACKRFMSDLQRDDMHFDAQKVERAVSFISKLRHFTGSASGKEFILEPWQTFIVANILGFYWNDGRRRFTSSYICVARKNGKTSLSAALSIYFLVADGEPGAEVLLCANSKEQARIAFSMCRNYIRTIDPKEALLKSYRADVTFDATNSKLKVLAADDSKLDGYNCSFGLIDEFHASPDGRVRQVIRSSMGQRTNPHLCTITTAGFDKTYPCYRMQEVAIDVLNGVKVDDDMFIAIFTLDDEDNWEDPNVWIKANPNIGITVSEEYIRGQVNQAINNPSDEVPTKTKLLNVWCDVNDVWIPDHYFTATTRQISMSEFAGEQCYIGVDLASTGDLTAVAKLVVRDDTYYFHVDYYLPESALREKSDKDMYRQWALEKKLHITPGNVTDYDYITNDIMALCDIVTIVSVGYDKWNAVQWAIDATDKGLNLEEYSQSIGNFNKPTREFERLMLSGKVVIDANPINRFCLANVTLKHDHNGNVKPHKGLERKKIDGVIAMIQALGMYLQTPRYTNEIFAI